MSMIHENLINNKKNLILKLEVNVFFREKFSISFPSSNKLLLHLKKHYTRELPFSIPV